MTRIATAEELNLFRTPEQRSLIRAAILQPTTVYTAQINQTFSTWDQVLELTYDNGSGTLSDVLPDMTLLIGSTAGAHDIGVVRIRDKDAAKFYIQETSDVQFANNQYLTVLADFSLWARPVLISAGVPYMDSGTAYSDQHTNWDPQPNMGPNRVLKLESASVSTQFDGSGSYCLSSSISAWSWSCATASSFSGTTTSTPTFGFDTVGWHIVYLTITAANGKTFFGVRYVYVWDDDNQPTPAEINQCRGDVESGGWSFELTLYEGADVTTIRDHALVILFAEDFYGSTKQSIGPVTGCENILAMGWIAKETIGWHPEQGSVQFTVYGAHYFMQQIPPWPDGVELTTTTPAAWTEIQALTVNLGLYHFLRWRTTATRVMDIYLTDNTLYAKEVSSLAQNLWEQMQEMAFAQVFARPGVNALNQLYIEVNPQLVPGASRSWPTVMTITKPDLEAEITLERKTMNEVSILYFSGVSVNSSGVGLAYFSLAPGHAQARYGKPEIQDRLLLQSQSQSNTLAGMYYAWRNNPYPDIPVLLSANNRLIDCFPRQNCAISIEAGDTLRGVAYSGNLIPTAVAYVHNAETGRLNTEATFEAETGLAASIVSQTGDIPGSGDISVPPVPSLPPLPPLPVPIPGTTPTDPSADLPVIIHSTTYGLIYTENINASSPTWQTINAGLTSLQYGQLNHLFICPNGSLYAGFISNESGANPGAWIARAPSIGGTFAIIEDKTSILAKEGGALFSVMGLAYNPLVAESVCYVLQGASGGGHAYIGAGGSYAQGYAFTNLNTIQPASHADGLTEQQYMLSYGFGNWMLHAWSTAGGSPQNIWRLNAGATAIVSQVSPGGINSYNIAIRAGTTGILFIRQRSPVVLKRADDNDFSSLTTVSSDTDVNNEGMGVDATGGYLMTQYGAGLRGRSSDGGATWVGIPNLAFATNYHFRNAGDLRWLAAGGGNYVELTEDFGNSWTPKTGNLNTILLTGPSTINMARAVGYT